MSSIGTRGDSLLKAFADKVSVHRTGGAQIPTIFMRLFSREQGLQPIPEKLEKSQPGITRSAS
jgi:hypothetical protein